MEKTNFLLKTAFVVFILFCLVTIVKLQFDFNELSDRRADLLLEVDAINERIAALQDTLNTPFDEEYIIKIAKEKLNMRLPEEIVFYNDINK